MTPRFLVYIFLVLTTFSFGLANFKKFSVSAKLLILLVTLVFVFESFSRVLAFEHKNSMPCYHGLILVQIILYTLIYYPILVHSSTGKRILFFFATLCFLLSCLNSLYNQTISSFPSLGTLNVSFLVVNLSLASFYQLLKNASDKAPWTHPWFWLNTGNLFFYLITFFIFGFFNPMVKIGNDIPEWQYIVIWLANLILYGSYLTSLILDKRQYQP
jgi:hypothetical protein